MTLKRSNEYAEAFGRLYAKVPKAVFAAVALSYATWASGKETASFDEAVYLFIEEWRTLYDNGVVSQKPPRRC